MAKLYLEEVQYNKNNHSQIYLVLYYNKVTPKWKEKLCNIRWYFPLGQFFAGFELIQGLVLFLILLKW